jgi:hypothetical protein
MGSTAGRGANRGARAGDRGAARPESGPRRGWGKALVAAFLPIGDAVAFHTAVVAAVLILDAVLVLVAGPGATGVLPNRPAVYLVLPAAAGLYMSLATVSSTTAQRGPVRGARGRAVPTLLLAWASAVVVLVAATDGPDGAWVLSTSAVWLYPACLAGVALPLTSLWFARPADPTHRAAGVCAAALPPVLALVVLLSRPEGGPIAGLTFATLVGAAVLFQVSGSMRGWSSFSVPSPVVPPAPRDGRAQDRPPLARPHPPIPSRHLPSPQPPVSVPGGLRSSPTTLSSPRGSSSGCWPDVVSTGFGWFDDLLLGGLPRRGQIAVVEEPGEGGDQIVWGALAEGLRRGETAVIVTASWSVREIAERMEHLAPGFTEYDRGGRVVWVDGSGQGSAARLTPPAIAGPGDCVRLLTALHAGAREAARRSPRGFCVGFLGVSSLIDVVGQERGLAVLRNAVAVLRASPALVTYQVELRPELVPVIKEIQADLDGTLIFRSLDGRPAVKVLRLTPVANRGWVECGFGGRGNWLVPRPRPRGRGFDVPTTTDRRPSVG